MPDSIGTAFVDVALDPKQLTGQLGAIEARTTSGFGKLGSKAGLAMATGIGAAVAGAVAAGKYLYGVGEQFDAMSDTIRVSTGKTGKELENLSKTAKQVGTDVPASFEDAGKSVSVLSTRLGLTGKPLRQVSDQMLELSRLSGVDLSEALNSVTRMLGDAGLSGAKASEGIDKLWRAAQASQVPITRLSDLATKFGGPMRQLGFSFEETLAILAKFEKEGVNTELVMGSMRIALGKMAKAGKDPQKELRLVMERIRDMGDAGKANALAIATFGARAGPDMAAAIREGRFSIDDLLKTITGGRDTVLKASKDTRDFAEEWLLFKNRVAVAVEPAARRMFSAIGAGMAALNKQMPGLINRLNKQLVPGLVNFGKAFEDLGPQVKSLGPAFKSLAPVLKDLGPAFEDLGAIVKDLMPVWKVLAAVIVANVKIWAEQLKGFLQILEGVLKVIRGLLEGDWRMAWEGAKQILQGFVTSATAQVRVIWAVIQQAVGPITQAATAIGKGIYSGIMAGVTPLVGFVTSTFASVRSAISSALGSIQAAATAVGQAITNAVRTALSTLASLVSGVFNAVRSAITGATSAIASAATAVGRAIVTGVQSGTSTIVAMVTGVFNTVRTTITNAASGALAAARTVGAAIVSGVRAGLSALVSTVQGLLNQAIGAVRSAAGQAATAAVAIGTSIVAGIRSGLAGVYAAVKGGLDKTWSAITAVAGAAAGAAAGIGYAIVRGVISGLGGFVSEVGGAIASKAKGAIDWATSHVGSTAEEYSKKQLGDPIPRGMIAGIVEGEKPVSDAIAKTVAGAIEAGRKAIADSREAFSSSWGALADEVLKAFDAVQARIKTSAEKQLAAMELKRQIDDMRAAVVSARTELEQAKAAQAALAPQEGESDAEFQARAAQAAERVKAAQKALDDALYEQRRFALERQAEQERVQLDARIALKRKHLEESLAAEGKALATGQVNAEKAQKDTIAMLRKYGVTYKSAGAAVGTAFATGMREALNKAMGDLEAVLGRIKRAIAGVEAANAGVGKSTKAATAALSTGYAAATGLGAPAGLAAPSATTYGAGTLYAPRSPFATMTRELGKATAPTPVEPAPVVVRVYIGDEELRGIVRTEVGYIDDATARVVLAGGR